MSPAPAGSICSKTDALLACLLSSEAASRRRRRMRLSFFYVSAARRAHGGTFSHGCRLHGDWIVSLDKNVNLET